MIRPRATSVTSSTMRRSKRSMMIPAGTERMTYGRIRAAPTMPSRTGSSLSAYTTTSSATRYSQSPMPEMNSPANSRTSALLERTPR